MNAESESVEFKPSLSQIDNIIESVSAFSNTKGGRIEIGKKDDGTVAGIQIGKDTIENLANQIKQNTDPPVYPSIKILKTGGKDIILVSVEESKSKPTFAFGRAFKRVGKSNHKLGYEEIRKLAVLSSKIYWDEQACEGADIKDLDEKKVRWFLDERERKRNVAKPEDMPLDDLLINIRGAKTVGGRIKPTNAGILFFGKNPQKFFVNSGIRVAKFKGADVTHPVLDRVDCKGTVWEIIDTAQEFIRRNIRLLSFRTPTDFRRTEKFEYPIDALREAMINALIHRDYSEPADVRVFLFDDGVEIINPGTFPEGVTPEKPTHKPVNPTLCSLTYDIGFIEKYGSGIKMMRKLCREWESKEPHYELHPVETKIVFESRVKDTTYVEVMDVSDKLNERQRKAMYFVQKKGFITRKEYMEINGVSNKTAYIELKDLVSKDMVAPSGKGRGVKYSIER